jgi:hypothetical protein
MKDFFRIIIVFKVITASAKDNGFDFVRCDRVGKMLFYSTMVTQRGTDFDYSEFTTTRSLFLILK